MSPCLNAALVPQVELRSLALLHTNWRVAPCPNTTGMSSAAATAQRRAAAVANLTHTVVLPSPNGVGSFTRVRCGGAAAWDCRGAGRILGNTEAAPRSPPVQSQPCCFTLLLPLLSAVPPVRARRPAAGRAALGAVGGGRPALGGRVALLGRPAHAGDRLLAVVQPELAAGPHPACCGVPVSHAGDTWAVAAIAAVPCLPIPLTETSYRCP